MTAAEVLRDAQETVARVTDMLRENDQRRKELFERNHKRTVSFGWSIPGAVKVEDDE